MRWESGRQGTGYRKLRLWQSDRLFSDAYLIDYPPHTRIPTHVDKVPGKRHYRINILLWGQDNFRGETLFSLGPLKFFRPDISPHSVEEVSRRRLVLSIGWALPENNHDSQRID